MEAIIQKLGFNDKFTTLLLLCVTPVSYSILVNVEPKGLIKPSRSIRQGDPLSLFLFLICIKGLHNLIYQAASLGDIHRFTLSKRSPSLTHPLYANDSLLFYKSIVEEVQNVLEVLKVYEEGLGQQINCTKTNVFLFSVN